MAKLSDEISQRDFGIIRRFRYNAASLIENIQTDATPMHARPSLLWLATIGLALSACNNHNNGFDSGQAASSTGRATTPKAEAPADAATASKAFLAANQNKPGVKTTASGLQYKINQPGSGKHPKTTDVVSVEYEGRLIDGNVFDSSAKHGNTPVMFTLNQVIPGWIEGVQLMQEGADYTFYVPAELAYGENGVPNVIPANSALIFNVKLVKIGE